LRVWHHPIADRRAPIIPLDPKPDLRPDIGSIWNKFGFDELDLVADPVGSPAAVDAPREDFADGVPIAPNKRFDFLA
jgi:hypothetical protein